MEKQQHTQQSPHSAERNDSSRALIIAFLIGLLIGIGATWLWLEVARVDSNVVATPQEQDTGQTPNDAVAPGEASSIAVPSQQAGREITVDRVSLASPAWVVIHEIRNGELGNALGAAWFPAGEQSGTVRLLRGTETATSYFAVLYSDDGDRLFEFGGADEPLYDENGELIRVSFQAR